MLLEAYCSAASTLRVWMAGNVGHGRMQRRVLRWKGKSSEGGVGELIIGLRALLKGLSGNLTFTREA